MDAPRAPRRWRRRVGLASLVLLVVALAAFLASLRDPTPRILALRGELADVREGPLRPGNGHVDQDVELTSTSGLAVELSIRRPAGEEPARRPLVLLLAGHRTGRSAAQLIPDTRGVVVAAMSYPTHLRRIEGPRDVLAARRAILGTPAAAMLCLDYLAARAYVDPTRIELLGVSLGAPFACVAGALDARFARVWSVHGGGSPARLFEAALRRELSLSAARTLAAGAIVVLAHGLTLAPEDWVGRIAPRPFVMINAAEDQAIPRECIDLLYEAAGQPKELVWIAGGHIDKRDEEAIVELCDLVLARME